MREELLSALRRMVYESGAYSRVASRMEDECGWAEGSGESRLSQMLNPHDPHRFPAERLYVAIEESGLDYVTPLLQLALLRSDLAREQRKPPIRVGDTVERRRRA